MYKQIKYFKGLNGLRFFAAYLVVLHHAEQIRLKNEIFNLKELSLFNNGGLAVTFFFVLSGFLISYLLLKEQSKTNNISIRRFYLRRILRIWPIYYLLVFLGTILMPFFLKLINYSYNMPYEFNDVILYFIFFTPFMVNILYGHHFLEPLWSIGVEELFYIIWAPLFKFFKKHILFVVLFIIAVKFFLLVTSDTFNFPPIVLSIIKILQFESMAIGGLTAYIIYHRKKEIEKNILFSKFIQVIIIIFIMGKLFASKFLVENLIIFDFLYNSGIFSHLILNFSFAWLIVNISLNKKSLIKLDNKVLNFLGEISYGIYMYHMLIIFGIILLLKNQLVIMSALTSSILYYFLITFGVILVSYFSKILFENYFLGLKEKFSVS